MALPGLFPIYPDPIPMKYQVSLALPPIPISEISKSIGITAGAPFLIPNIDFLEKFVNGDIGIADKMTKEAMFKSLNTPFAQKDEKVFKKFGEINNIKLPDLEKYKKDGKIKLPKDQVNVTSLEGLGLKAFEKTLLTSIFETQKPYIEVAKLVIQEIAKIEDIIARIMPLLGVPLTTKSLKPIVNSGAENRPKALGYQNGKELKAALARLQQVSKKGNSVIKIDKDGNASREKAVNDGKSGPGLGSGTASVTNGNSSNQNWKIISTVYSTGVYIPGIEYKYTYIDLPEEVDIPKEEIDLGLDKKDPWDKYKPEKIILGVFRANGEPFNPLEKLKTINLVNGQVQLVDTQFERARWLIDSPKWQMNNIFPNNGTNIQTPIPYVCASISGPIYKWEKGVLGRQDSATSPGEGWSIKKYGANEKSLIDKDIDAIEGDPMIVGFESPQTAQYTAFFNDLVKFEFFKTEDLEQQEKDKSASEILNNLNVTSHLQNVFKYGQAKSSVYKDINGAPAYPEKMKFSFQPFRLYSKNALEDKDITAFNKSQGIPPGYIWVDPESDYDTKIIRVDPTSKIEFLNAQSEPVVKSDIKSFVKNKLTININNGQNFDIQIIKNGQSEVFENVNQYVLENWNYNSDVTLAPQARIQNNNTYITTIWSKTPTRQYVNSTSTITLAREVLMPDLQGLLANSNNLAWIYELSYSNGKRYYKRYKYEIQTTKLAILALLGVASPILLTSLITLYQENPNKSWTIHFKASDILDKLDEALKWIDHGLDELGVPRKIEFSIGSNDYSLNLRIDELIKKVKNLVPESDLLDSLLDKISKFEFKFTFYLRDLFPRRVPAPLNNGMHFLKDSFGTRVELVNEEITRWYYIYNRPLFNNLPNQSSFDEFSLPPFGKEYVLSINHNSDPGGESKNLAISRSETTIPLYKLKVTNDNFPYGKIIDPSVVANQRLSTDKLFSEKKYGHGSKDNPQEIEVIKRFMLTDTDTESYYIIEGVLVDKNPQPLLTPGGANGPGAGAGGGNDSNYYKLPHALGAIKVFISMMVDVFAKLIPTINKIIALFKNPANFVVEVLKEKMGDGFSIFSKESFKTFETAKKEKDKLKTKKPSERESSVKNIFKNSPLSNHVFVNKKGDFKFLLDGLALIPFGVLGTELPFGMEMNFEKIPESPFKLIFKETLSTAKVKNMQAFLKPSLKDFKGPGSDGLAAGLNLSDLKSLKDDPVYKKSKKPIDYNNPNNFEIIDIKYSTGSFINGVNYNYIYINQDLENVLNDAQNIVNKNDEELNVPDVQKAIDTLSEELKKDPNNKAIKDMLGKLKNKLRGLNDNTQPLLKMLLGFVTLPIKIIAGIIEWLMNFFKSLTNPLTLPSKIVELLSFTWIMKFFTPLGILELAGVKFKPEEIVKWCALVNIPNVKPPNVNPQIPNGVNLPELKYYKDAWPKGKYLLPDDLEIVDWNEFLSMPHLPKLPIYTAKMHREMCTRPLKIMMPTLCLFEKIINGIIDFIWSLLGLEALIKAPHIKLCSDSKDPDVADAVKLANDLAKDANNILDSQKPPVIAGTDDDSGFVYDITLDDGTVVKGLNYTELQKYIKEHEEIGYDFKF